ncbi:MAG TPA: iron ABC transporter permease [Clostridia bacterium]|nr:iron ABC transporter permease [Clostridia bacterium]
MKNDDNGLRGKIAKLNPFGKEPLVTLVIITIFIFLFIFIVYPLYKILIISVTDSNGKLSFEAIGSVLANKYYLQSLMNSLGLALAVSVISLFVGYIFAYAITRVDMPFKPFFKMMATLPIISPPFVLSLSMIMLFGRNGLITNKLFGLENVNIYGFNSLLVVQVLSFFPIAYLTLSGILEAIDPSVEDAALNLGAQRGRIFRTVTLPLSFPGIASALLLVMVQSLQDFSNPMVLGGNFHTLVVQAYVEIIGMYDMKKGAVISIMLLLPTLAAFLLQKYWVSGKSYVTVTGKPSYERPKLNNPVIKWSAFALCSLFTAVIMLFYGTVIYGSFIKIWGVNNQFTLENYKYIFTLGSAPVKNTLKLAAYATPVGGLLSMIIAFLVVRKQFIGRKAMEFVSLLAFAIPGTVIGIGYILSFNQKPLLLTGTGLILVMAFIFRNMPVGIESGTATLKQIDRSIEEASTNLGASSFLTFRKITLPLIKSAFFSGLVYAFVRAMTAVSAVILLISPRWNLVTVSILAQVENLRLGVAAAYVIILIIMMMVAIGIMDALVKRLVKKKETA